MAADNRVEDLSDDLAVPRRNGELVFEAPWEGRAFGMAVALSDNQHCAWDAFRNRLAAEIAAAEEHGDGSAYYERWLASFERLLNEVADRPEQPVGAIEMVPDEELTGIVDAFCDAALDG